MDLHLTKYADEHQFTIGFGMILIGFDLIDAHLTNYQLDQISYWWYSYGSSHMPKKLVLDSISIIYWSDTSW